MSSLGYPGAFNLPSQPFTYAGAGDGRGPPGMGTAHSTSDLYMNGGLADLGQTINRGQHLVASSLGLSPIVDEPWVRTPHTSLNSTLAQQQQGVHNIQVNNAGTENASYLQRHNSLVKSRQMQGLNQIQSQRLGTSLQQPLLPNQSLAGHQNLLQPQVLQNSLGELPTSLQQSQFSPYQSNIYQTSQQSLFSNQNTMRTANSGASNLTAAFNLRNKMDGLGQSQNVIRNQQVGYGVESDADIRFRRSKELFDQAQSARHSANLAQATAKLNINNQSSENRISGLSNPNYEAQGPQTLLQQQQQQQDNFMKQQQQQLQAELYKQDLMNQQAAVQQQQSRAVENLYDVTSGATRQRSHSADARNFYRINQDLHTTGGLADSQITFLPTSEQQIPNNLQQIPFAHTAQFAPPPQVATGNSTGYPTTLPVELAHKLHSQHALALQLANQTTTGQEYNNPAYRNTQDLQQKAALLNNTPNKMVSFNLPDGTTVDHTGKVTHRRLSELFPDCEECRRLEESRRLSRANLKLKRNNSDTTWNEFLKEANNQDRYNSMAGSGMSIQDEENLRNLAKMVSATFSGDSDSNPDVADPRSLNPTLKSHPLYKSTPGGEVRYNAAGQRIPTVPSILSGRESSLLERLERQRLLIERELQAARSARDYESLTGAEPYYMDLYDDYNTTNPRMQPSEFVTPYMDLHQAKRYDYQDMYPASYLQAYERGRSRDRISLPRKHSLSKDKRIPSRGERLSPDRRHRSKPRVQDDSFAYRRRVPSPDDREDSRGRLRDRLKEPPINKGTSGSRYSRDYSPSHAPNYMQQHDDYIDQRVINNRRYYQKGMGGSSRNIAQSSNRPDRPPNVPVGPDDMYAPRRSRSTSKDRQYMDSDESGIQRRINSMGPVSGARDLSGRRHASHEQLSYVDRNKERFVRDGESSSSSIDRLSPDRYKRKHGNHMSKSHEQIAMGQEGVVPPRSAVPNGPVPPHHSRSSGRQVNMYQDTNDRRKLPDTPYTNSNESGYSSAHTNNQQLQRGGQDQAEMQQDLPPRRARRYAPEDGMGGRGMDERQIVADNNVNGR